MEKEINMTSYIFEASITKKCPKIIGRIKIFKIETIKKNSIIVVSNQDAQIWRDMEIN